MRWRFEPDGRKPIVDHLLRRGEGAVARLAEIRDQRFQIGIAGHRHDHVDVLSRP